MLTFLRFQKVIPIAWIALCSLGAWAGPIEPKAALPAGPKSPPSALTLLKERLSKGRSQAKNARAEAIKEAVRISLTTALKGRLNSVEVELSEPTIQFSGHRGEVVFETVSVSIEGLDVAGIALRGLLRIEDLHLDFGAFGLGKLKITEVPQLFPELESTREDVNSYLSSNGFQGPFVRTKENGLIELGGHCPLRILLLKTNPRVAIAGEFRLNQTVLSFAPQAVEVTNTNGAVAAAIRRKIMGEKNRRFDFADLFQGFSGKPLSVGEGYLHIVDGEKRLYTQSLEDLDGKL